MASAVGQIIEVPIIIRSLADSIGMLQQDDLPIPFHDDFLMTLDIGAHKKDINSRVVGKYDFAWWTGRKPRSIGLVEILNFSNILDCIDTHKKQLASTTSEFGSWPTMPASLESDDRAAAGRITGPEIDTGAVSEQCSQCLAYNEILINVINDMHTIQHSTTSLATASKTQWFIDMRRASTFNLLHEAVLLKETGSISPATAQSFNRDTTNTVRRNAQEEVDRLRSLPVSSHKWTWGEILTEQDVLGLRRSGTRPQKGNHSGYDLSLKEGRFPGEDSSHSHPKLNDRYEEVPVEVYEDIPFSNATDIPYFSERRHLEYNPLRQSPPTARRPLERTTDSIKGPAVPASADLVANLYYSELEELGSSSIHDFLEDSDIELPGPAQVPATTTTKDAAMSPAYPPAQSSAHVPAAGKNVAQQPPIIPDDWSTGDGKKFSIGYEDNSDRPVYLYTGLSDLTPNTPSRQLEMESFTNLVPNSPDFSLSTVKSAPVSAPPFNRSKPAAPATADHLLGSWDSGSDEDEDGVSMKKPDQDAEGDRVRTTAPPESWSSDEEEKNIVPLDWSPQASEV